MKKTIAFVLALVLCLSLCACGREISDTGEHDVPPTTSITPEEKPQNPLIGAWVGIYDVDVDFPTIVFNSDYTFEVYDLSYTFGDQKYELSYTDKYTLEGDYLILWDEDEESARCSYSVDEAFLQITDVDFPDDPLWFVKSKPESELTDGWWHPTETDNLFHLDGCSYRMSGLRFYTDGTLQMMCDGYSNHGTYSIIHDGNAICIEVDGYDDIFYIDLDAFGLLTLAADDGDMYVLYLVSENR